MKWTILSALLGLLAFSACKKENNMNKVPQITYLDATDSIIEGRGNILIKFSFEDGDADIVTGDSNNIEVMAKMQDGTTSNLLFSMPSIPDSYRDPAKGLKGFATVLIRGAFFIVEDSLQVIPDTVYFDLFVRDKKGNLSNTISTPAVLIYPD